MKLLLAGAAVDVQRDRNHLRLTVEHTHNASVAILYKSSNRFGSVDDLEGVQRRGQSSQHLGLIHGQIDGTELQQWMSAGEQFLRIDISHRAGGFNVHITAHQNRADGGSRHNRLGLLIVAD